MKVYLLKYKVRRFIFYLHHIWNWVAGYQKLDGKPRKCPYCKCKTLETYETFRHDQGFIEEYWVRCSNCKKQVGVWAYGHWQN